MFKMHQKQKKNHIFFSTMTKYVFWKAYIWSTRNKHIYIYTWFETLYITWTRFIILLRSSTIINICIHVDFRKLHNTSKNICDCQLNNISLWIHDYSTYFKFQNICLFVIYSSSFSLRVFVKIIYERDWWMVILSTYLLWIFQVSKNQFFLL